MHKAFNQCTLYFLFLSMLFSTPSFAQSEKDEIQEIAIVSLLGDFFVGRRFGSPKPSNWWYVPVPEWEVNNLVQSTLLDYLEGNKKITGTVWEVEDPYILTCVHKFTISEECTKAFFSAAKEKGYEYVLVILPKSTYQFAATQTESFAKTHGEKIPGGYGLIKSSGLNCAFALFSIGVYNVETEKSLGNLEDNEKLDWNFLGLPCYSKRYWDKATEKKIKWRDDFENFSDLEKNLMKKYIRRGIAEDLELLLPKMKLFKD